MLDIIFLVILGVFTGVFTGLTPGIHPNTVIFSSLPFYFSLDIKFLYFMSFLAALSVSHTFHDFLPAVFLGAPEAETALASLPGAEKAAKGEGIEAFHYTLFGGLFSVFTLVFITPVLFLVLENLYSMVKPVMHYLLLFFVLILIWDSGDCLSSTIVTILSGSLGMISFSMPVNSQYVLVPVFSGLFAIPAITSSLRAKHSIPEQNSSTILKNSAFRGGILGCIAGVFTGIFPGLSPAVSTSFFSPLMDRSDEFLAAMGGVNSADIIMTFLSLYLIGKARSGAAVALQAISKIRKWEVVFLVGVSFLSISFSLYIGFKTPKYFILVLNKVSVRKIMVMIVLVILIIVFRLTNFLGLLILISSSLIGYYAAFTGVRKSTISVLLIPSIFFFSGFAGFI